MNSKIIIILIISLFSIIANCANVAQLSNVNSSQIVKGLQLSIDGVFDTTTTHTVTIKENQKACVVSQVTVNRVVCTINDVSFQNGNYTVQISNSEGTATSSFIYAQSYPVVTDHIVMLPNKGEKVTINGFFGTNFNSPSVSINGNKCDVTKIDSTLIQCTMPDMSATDSVNIHLEVDGWRSTYQDNISYNSANTNTKSIISTISIIIFTICLI